VTLQVQARVTCDAPGCASCCDVFFSEKLQPTLFKKSLREGGWWCVEVLSTPAPIRQLCPKHLELAPNAR